MSKNKLLGGLLLLLPLVITGCSNESNKTNSAPTIVGVKDVQCIVNSTVDFLDGVAALDKEDGDITPLLEITITPTVEVKDGFATFNKDGEYVAEYKIKDSEGKESKKRSYIDVVTRDKYLDFVMPQGFSYERNGKAQFEVCGMVNNEFVVKAVNHEVAEDIQIKKSFSVQTNIQYTYIYKVNSNCEGKVKALANGVECGELKLEKGENELAFKHTVFSDEEKENVLISLCFGGINDKIDLVIEEVRVEFPQEEGKIVDLTEHLSLYGRVISRIENQAEGNCWAEDEGKTAVLEITKTTPEIWLGGMFINTGVTLKPETNYTISFDLVAEQHKDYEVIIQRGQWDELKLDQIYNPEDGHYSRDVYIGENADGPLWLYIQSGTEINRIRMKNIKVEEHLNKVGKDSFLIEDFEEFHADGYNCQFASRLGSFTYTIDKFSEIDSQEKVTSPTFFIGGSSGNYVLSFRAKSSAPIEVIVAVPVAGGWDPTLMWNRITLSEQENVYSFFFNMSGSDRDYNIVWQFGSTNNQKQHDVKVEISDVSINLRNRELDG